MSHYETAAQEVPSGGRRILGAMTPEMRSDRTERLLSGRLDELASTLERPGAPAQPAARLLELASVATQHAIELHLLSHERATAIWEAAARRHPVLRTAA
jgi:hypothetical protein